MKDAAALKGIAEITDGDQRMTSRLTALLAVACAVVTSGSYFARPLTATIGFQIGLVPWMAGMIVTVSQLGFVVGLLFIAPLGDILENRKLLVGALGLSSASLLLASLAQNGWVFLCASFGIGVASTAVQLLVAMAAFMSESERRGHIVGVVTSGLLIGMLASWPVASVISALYGWRALFGADAAVVLLLAACLGMILPRRFPKNAQNYTALVGSLWHLLRVTPELRRRAVSQACLFGSFSLFWTAVPQELQRHYLLSASAVALFGLAGAGGALVAPVAGRFADQGRSDVVAIVGTLVNLVAFLLAVAIPRLWALAAVAILVDAGVQANHVISQRIVLSLHDEAANRLNSLYIATFFIGGALGSAAAGPLYVLGWKAIAIAGAACAVTVLVLRICSTNR
jgi:predicted MFS family arabinose efflux permease